MALANWTAPQNPDPHRMDTALYHATLSLNLSLSSDWGLLSVLEDLVVRSELSIESGDGVVEFLWREDPIFRSATVMGHGSWQHEKTLMDPLNFIVHNGQEYCKLALLRVTDRFMIEMVVQYQYL